MTAAELMWILLVIGIVIAAITIGIICSRDRIDPLDQKSRCISEAWNEIKYRPSITLGELDEKYGGNSEYQKYLDMNA